MTALGFFIFVSTIFVCDTWLVINGYDGLHLFKRPKKISGVEE